MVREMAIYRGEVNRDENLLAEGLLGPQVSDSGSSGV